MEKLNDLVFLLPDYELEGFPRSLSDDQAARVLGGWVALWHPVLMCGAGKIPRWHQATRLPSELASTLFVLPPISREAIDSGAAAQISAAGGLLLEPGDSWQQFQSEILSNFPQLEINATASELASEYAALAYTYLQIQLMTRQLRYTSNLDVALFEEQVMRSTEAVIAGDTEQARVGLQACFDTLGQERDHYYSNDANLLDITLLAETTLGKSLRRQLDSTAHSTFIASADLLRTMQSKAPENFESLQGRLSAGTACLAGGLDQERLLPVEGRESAAYSLYQGQGAYQALNVPQPTVFARSSFGLNPDSVTLLARFGFQGALLIPFTGGKYPTSAQPKISWESHDGTRLPAVACQPLDAASASSFLALGWTLGEALDRQHVPTLVFAHWPGRTNEYFDLLQLACSRTPALGRFVLADRYFAETSSPYHHERLDADKFSFNWLAEAEDAGALIASTKYAQKIQCRLRSLRNLANLVWQLTNRRQKADWPADESGGSVAPAYSLVPTTEWAPRLARAIEDAGALVDQSGSSELYQSLKQQLSALSQEYMQQLSPLLLKKQIGVDGGDSTTTATAKLLFNPRANPVRSTLRTTASELFDAAENWHFASGPAGKDRLTCVDLPSMGFVVAPFVNRTAKPEKFVLADAAGMLRNEFMEAQIDMQRGHLRSLHIPAKRGNRLSMMVAYREKSGTKFEHSEMVARSVDMLTCSSVLGIIRSEGHLLWHGQNCGEFSIDFEIRRGSRLISAVITLNNLKYRDERNPWLSSFILRLAWPTEAAILKTFMDGRISPWSGSKVIAPELIEIDEAEYQTQYLTGGLAFHARQEMRFLETILATNGQTSVRHRVGFAVDLPYPLSQAQQFIDKPYQLDLSGPHTAASGWLVSVDNAAVHVDLECPLQDDQGRNVGVRIFVSELQGKSTTSQIQFFRDVADANRVDYQGAKISRVTTNGDALTVALRSGEQSLIDVLWKQ